MLLELLQLIILSSEQSSSLGQNSIGLNEPRAAQLSLCDLRGETILCYDSKVKCLRAVLRLLPPSTLKEAFRAWLLSPHVWSRPGGPGFQGLLDEDAQNRSVLVSKKQCPEDAFVVKCQKLLQKSLVPTSAGETIHRAPRRASLRDCYADFPSHATCSRVIQKT